MKRTLLSLIAIGCLLSLISYNALFAELPPKEPVVAVAFE